MSLGVQTLADGSVRGAIHLEVLVVLGVEPLGFSEIRDAVSLEMGRPINSGSINSALKRAIATGCAVKTTDGYREPDDVLTQMDREMAHRPAPMSADAIGGGAGDE